MGALVTTTPRSAKAKGPKTVAEGGGLVVFESNWPSTGLSESR